jgi:hypothetical protein
VISFKNCVERIRNNLQKKKLEEEPQECSSVSSRKEGPLLRR